MVGVGQWRRHSGMAGWKGRHGAGMARKACHDCRTTPNTNPSMVTTRADAHRLPKQVEMRQNGGSGAMAPTQWNGRMEWTPWCWNGQESVPRLSHDPKHKPIDGDHSR